MKSFIEMFTAARKISTPLVAVRTFDATSTIQGITKSLGQELQQLVPLICWDSVHGLRGLNDAGKTELADMLTKVDGLQPATVDLVLALATIEYAKEDVIVFIQNPHLVWTEDKRSIQGMWNLRNPYKANGNMLVMTLGVGDELPGELQQDTLVLEEPLPTREELSKVVTDTFAFAAQKKEYAACKTGATPEVVKAATDALIGLPMFPADQAVAMNLDLKAGKLDIDSLWQRKKDIVSQNPGLTYHPGKETLGDMYGLDELRAFGKSFMNGKYQPTVIVRMDEIEKQLAGAGTDSSGIKGNLLGEWLTWVNDRRIFCTLLVGVPGASKSHFCYCIAGEYGKPCINYSIPAMEDKYVGEAARHQRTAHKILDAISDEKIWLIATSNDISKLPPEVISRFQLGGIWFVDAPDANEKKGIMDLKVKAYKLDKQDHPDMKNWTGRDIDNCARRSETLGLSLVDAGKAIIPLFQSNAEQMDILRQSAHNRYLSVNKPGAYQYTKAEVKEVHSVKSEIVEGRKFR